MSLRPVNLGFLLNGSIHGAIREQQVSIYIDM